MKGSMCMKKKYEELTNEELTYANQQFNIEQMEQIWEGLEKRLNVSWYTNPKFNSRQMREIRLGLEAGLDVSWYAKPEFDAEQMKKIFWGLVDDYAVLKVCKKIVMKQENEK